MNMDPDLKLAIGLALILGGALGLLAVLLTPAPPRVEVTVVRSDPAAYHIAALLEEARRITEEAAGDT